MNATNSAPSIEAAMQIATGAVVGRLFYSARGIRMYSVGGQSYGIARL